MKSLSVSKTCQINNLASIYKKYFSNIKTGYFVEVGAYDGESWSNTSCLADIGWAGLYIEPIEHHMNLCKERHKTNNIIFEQVAIGKKEKEIKISFLGGLSSANAKVNTAHKTIYNIKSKDINYQLVKQVRLETVLTKHNVPKKFDLLVVDVEGNEKDVFSSFNLKEYTPSMIIVELCDVHPSYDNYLDIKNNAKFVRNLITQHGYAEVYQDAINTIFVKDNLKLMES